MHYLASGSPASAAVSQYFFQNALVQQQVLHQHFQLPIFLTQPSDLAECSGARRIGPPQGTDKLCTHGLWLQGLLSSL
jgi:hypothetical protein